jgi:hypothetical protein
VENSLQQSAAHPAAAAGMPPDITIAISPAAEQEIQRALLAENGAQAAYVPAAMWCSSYV